MPRKELDSKALSDCSLVLAVLELAASALLVLRLSGRHVLVAVLHLNGQRLVIIGRRVD